jgi:small subunit ribosomal protein S3Ae
LVAPGSFKVRNFGKTVCNKTIGTKLSVDNLKGRVVEVNLADLNKGDKAEDFAYRKIRLLVEDVEGKNCLTIFNGMDITTDKLRSVVRKWQTLIEGHCEIRTLDGYIMRVFIIGFTARRKGQIAKTSYAKASKVRMIRKRMIDIVQREANNVSMKELVPKLCSEIIAKKIEKSCESVYPLQNVIIRKVKVCFVVNVRVFFIYSLLLLLLQVLKSPKADAGRLADLHSDMPIAVADETGDKVEQPERQVVGDVPKKTSKAKN